MLKPIQMVALLLLVMVTTAQGCGAVVLPQPFSTPMDSRLVAGAPYLSDPVGRGGPAALAMAMTHDGHPVTVEEITLNLGKGRTYSPWSLAKFAQKFGDPQAEHFYGNPDHLLDVVKANKLAIIRLGLPLDPIKAGDYAVVVGYTPDGFVLNSGPANQQIFPWSDFLSAWYQANALTIMVSPL